MARKPFGGMTVSFKGCDDSIMSIMGSAPMPPSQMTKKLWAYVKRKHLMKKG